MSGTAGGGDQRRFGVEQGRRGVGAIAAEIRTHWREGGSTVRAVLGLGGAGGLALAGATLFGLVHVVGGAWHGNPKAMGFGVVLTTVSMWLLAGLAALVRMLARRDAG